MPRHTKSDYAELELSIRRRDEQHYTLDLRFLLPDNDADIRLQRGAPSLVQLPREELAALLLDPQQYGMLLTDSLLADADARNAVQRAFESAQQQGVPLRLRLDLDETSPELHNLRWETLHNVLTGGTLLTSEQIYFSRYLRSSDWRPVRLRSRTALRALVVIANPSNLNDYQVEGQPLPAFDVPYELAMIRESLGTMPVTIINEAGTVTVNTMIAHLRDGYDIVYLLAHGAMLQGEPYLWLEDEQGQAAVVAGADLLRRLQDLAHLPRLMVLGSCQSAGQGSDDRQSRNMALSALGPRLAAAGFPAVLAMQGNVALETLRAFLPVFFRELQHDGYIDRAVAVARSHVQERNDWWMPVLFLRLRSGRIWYVAGFGAEGADFEKWPALIRNIQRGNCTPIIGQRLTESVLDPLGDFARRWADRYGFPLAPHQREELPQVAQFLAINQDPQFPREELIEQLHMDLLERYADKLPAHADQLTLDELFALVSRHYRQTNPNYPYRVLAELPFRIYITANLTNLLTEELRAAGKDPQVEICRWNEDLEELPSIYDDEPDYQPSVERPLVYHLFGISGAPDSAVVAEDDYFDFLIGVSVNKELIPIAVREALADTGLLFLGFRIDDWPFRVLFRSLMSQEGRGRRRRYAHVAAQITPEEGRVLEPERARAYLETYFQEADIDIFWGSVEDFMQQLKVEWVKPDRGTGTHLQRGK